MANKSQQKERVTFLIKKKTTFMGLFAILLIAIIFLPKISVNENFSSVYNRQQIEMRKQRLLNGNQKSASGKVGKNKGYQNNGLLDDQNKGNKDNIKYQQNSNNIKFQLFDDDIQWPKENQPYHIYASVNSRLVLDMAKADDGFHDLILYQWQNSQNQMYYFKKSHDNFYHIINAETKEYMKKSQKTIPSTGVRKIKFSQDEDKLWQLVPAKKNAKNSFYILSPQKMAMDLNQGYANNGGQLILYNWNKNDNQVWFIRKNQQFFDPQQFNPQKYYEKGSQLLYKIMNNGDSINECITLEEMKKQMSSKHIPIPFWLGTPIIPKIEISEYPQQIVQQIVDLSNKIGKVKDNFRKKNQGPIFKPPKISLQCAKNHTVAYIWYGTKQMPEQYQQLLRICKNNTKLLTQQDYFYYVNKWNQLQPIYAVDSEDFTIRQRINLLKLLYLYFESGIYADFDTEIHQKCFQNVLADEIIFTNRMDQNVDYTVVFAISQIIVPEENFMMIRRKEHPQVKRMLQQQIMEHNERGGRRWRECKYRQCLILQCQRHYRDNTYKKGFD